jgi:hypothetical protein
VLVVSWRTRLGSTLHTYILRYEGSTVVYSALGRLTLPFLSINGFSQLTAALDVGCLIYPGQKQWSILPGSLSNRSTFGASVDNDDVVQDENAFVCLGIIAPKIISSL